MKKFSIAVMVMCLLLTGCGGSNFVVVSNEDMNAEITAENAAAGSTGSVGTFSVAENETVLIEPELKEGIIAVQFAPFGSADDIDADEKEILTQTESVAEAEISGTEPVELELGAGDYMVTATVTEKATGAVIIRTTQETKGITK